MSLTDEQCRVMETWANTTMFAENTRLHMLNTIQEKKIELLEAENAKLKARLEVAEEVLMTVNNWRKLGSETTWNDVVTAYAKWEDLK